MSLIVLNGHEFRVEFGPLIDATSASRMDPTWCHVDGQGHVHQWCLKGTDIPATNYDPTARYSVPSLRWILDFPGDDEYPDVGHYECRRCGERVEPGRTADTTRRYMPGLASYFVDGRLVSKEEFEASFRTAQEEGKRA